MRKSKFSMENNFNAEDLLLPIDLTPTVEEAALIWKVLLSLNICVEKNSVLFAHSLFAHKRYNSIFKSTSISSSGKTIF